MLKRERESQFPSNSRRSSVPRSGHRAGGHRRSPVFPVLSVLLLAVGFYVYEMPGRPWAQYLAELQHFLSDRDGAKVSPGPNASVARKAKTRPRVQDRPAPGKSARIIAPATVNRPRTKSWDKSDAKPVRLDISIGMGFRPVGFRIGAVSRSITLSPQPVKRMHRLPRFTASEQRYGMIRLGHGREYGFALDLAASGYRMFLDRNRNGDLRDDGGPMPNQGKGLFASKVILSLAQVTGITRLKGDYQLWIYTNPDSWKKGKMLFYAMTQLQGELMLKGQRYTAYLADNGPVDGDYRNDGISIDLNGDGKINRKSELFTKGKPVRIDGELYSFRITN